MHLIRRTLNQIQSPIGSTEGMLREFDGSLSLLDLSQGTPSYGTAPTIVDRITDAACKPDGARYTARPGLRELRGLLAAELSLEYSGNIGSEHILITAGCNQAFCVTISALAAHEDEVILAVPYYFNHDMWLRLEGIVPVYLFSADNFIPDPHVAETLISEKTRAIVLVTPGNPTGMTIPTPIIHAFADIAKANHIVLVLDETYRAFRPLNDAAAHGLFARPRWEDTVVSLYSFSKEFAIPGHRVGAVIGSPDLLVEVMKLFDCMAICAPRLGQEAAIEALTSAKDWRDSRVIEIRAKQIHFDSVFKDRPGGFELCTSGAFYGWVRHPVAGVSTKEVVRNLLLNHGILVLPGTIFSPEDDGFLRFSFGNLSHDEIDDLGRRLARFSIDSQTAASARE
jgi:aspartate/methionine/tyrosine aminotransferase